MNAQQTPLIDLLKNVPRTARLLVEENHSTTSIPVGKLCADAAEEIEALRKAAALVAAAEREACAKIVEQYCGAWDDAGYALSQAVRARGKE